MRVTLDDMPCEIDAPSIGDALGSAAAIAEEQGRVIVDVVVDGTRWTEEQLGSADLLGRGADRVELTSAGSRELVLETLDALADGLEQADELQREAAALLQADERAEAMGLLAEAIGIWQLLPKAVSDVGEALRLDLDEVRVADNPLSQRIAGLVDMLTRLRDVLDAKDTVSLADTLLYELPDVVAEWREVFDTLKQRGEAG